MRCECPELKRCCFCLPLRKGLLLWAYLKIFTESVIIIYLIDILRNFITTLSRFSDYAVEQPYSEFHNAIRVLITLEITLTSIALSLIVLDDISCVVFIVAAHGKYHKLMKVYYIYLLVMLGITTSVYILLLGVLSYIFKDTTISEFYWDLYFKLFLIQFIHTVIHVYFTLLVRSEMVKLSDDCIFKFQNNAAEAECTMISAIENKCTGETAIDSTANSCTMEKKTTIIPKN